MEGDSQFSYDSKRLKEIGSLTGFNRDPNNSIYFGLREQDSSHFDVRSIPNSRGGESNSSQGQRTVTRDKYEMSEFLNIFIFKPYS